MSFVGQHVPLPVRNHLWVWVTIPEETTAQELSDFFYECSVVVPPENISLVQTDKHVDNATASALVAIPFESFEHILQWLMSEKRLQVPRISNGGWKVTPNIQQHRRSYTSKTS